MKRSITLIFFIIAMLSVGAFSASAQQDFQYEELSFSVPDIMENDEDWALQQGFTYAFCDSQEKIELNISVYENDGFSYAGMDDESLENYASSLEDYFTQSGYVVEDTKVEAYNLSNGIEGVNVTVSLGGGEKGLFYWFTAESKCYDLEFYIGDEAYGKYVTEVMNTVSIVPLAAEQGGSQGNAAAASDYEKILEEEGVELTFSINYPVDFYDDYYASYDCLVWCDDEDEFEFDFYIESNDRGLTYYNLSGEALNSILEDSLNNASQQGINITDSSIEKIEINGKHGVKASYTYAAYGSICTEYDYYFSTADKVYSMMFYTYSDEADKAHQNIINSFSFEGKSYNGFKIPEGKTETKEYSVDGFTVNLPEFMAEDSEWVASENLTKGWTSEDGLFQFGILTKSNKDLNWVYTGFKDKDFKKIFEDQKADIDGSFTKYELIGHENVTVNGFDGIKISVAVEEDGCEYTGIHYYFSNEDTIYSIVIFTAAPEYDEYIDSIVNSIKIEGEALKIQNNTLIYVIVGAVVGGLSGLIGAIKKKKAKKKAPFGNLTVDANGNPVYFNPQTDAYRPQNMPGQFTPGQSYPQQTPGQFTPGQNYPQQTPAQGDDNNNGYIENSGYAPDYDYSNKLDITLNGTNDFSLTEYRRETANMEKKFTDDEE